VLRTTGTYGDKTYVTRVVQGHFDLGAVTRDNALRRQGLRPWRNPSDLALPSVLVAKGLRWADHRSAIRLRYRTVLGGLHEPRLRRLVTRPII